MVTEWPLLPCVQHDWENFWLFILQQIIPRPQSRQERMSQMYKILNDPFDKYFDFKWSCQHELLPLAGNKFGAYPSWRNCKAFLFLKLTIHFESCHFQATVLTCKISNSLWDIGQQLHYKVIMVSTTQMSLSSVNSVEEGYS